LSLCNGYIQHANWHYGRSLASPSNKDELDIISNADVTHLVRVRQLRLRLPYVASVGTEGRKALVMSYVTIGTNDSHSSR
jgi:hypothetical protein